jgi:small ligand-binding sensory domain FIST
MPNAAASQLRLGPYKEEDVARAARALLEQVGGRVTLGFVFVTPNYRNAIEDFLEVVQLNGHVELLVGCSTTGLIGSAIEAENETGCSLLFLNLPETKLRVVPIQPDHALHPAPGLAGSATPPGAWILLANPATPNIEPWIERWGKSFPGSTIIGTLTSAGSVPDSAMIFHQRAVVNGAGIAVGLEQGVRVLPVVSHACRPIGMPLTITGARDHFLRRLGSQSAYEALSAIYSELPDNDKAISRGNLFVGLAASEYVDDFEQGDFLIRTILGADPETGVVAIAGHPRIGQTLQFQLRDPKAARNDFRKRCSDLHARRVRPFASLLFSCIGRGETFFGEKSCDAGALVEGFGSHPSAGAFCAGEIGPAISGTFVHGYTASAALFCEPYEGIVPIPHA